MLRKLKSLFFLLAIIAAGVWLLGLISGVTFSFLGGVRAEQLGAVLFSISMTAEVLLYFFGWLAQR